VGRAIGQSVRQLLGRFSFGKGARARREEALGRLEQATLHYVEAGEPEQAARVTALRAEAAVDPAQRLTLLGQAIGYLSEDAGRELRLRRARLKLDLARSGQARFGTSELVALGRELEGFDEHALAAEAHELAGDSEGEARALVAAGAVERLEQMLEDQQRRTRDEREREHAGQRVRDLIASGRRREALRVARQHANDVRLLALGRELEARRALGPRVELVIDGERIELALGERIVVGRSDAAVNVGSPSVSREHLALTRGALGIEVVDLGSRNGTTLAGARLEAPVHVGERLELLLGGEVTFTIEPCPIGARLGFAGRVVHVALGPLRVGAWSIAPAEDGWLELRAPHDRPPFLGELRSEATIELCRGDELRERPGGPVRLRVAG
jgi:hypothetical protein